MDCKNYKARTRILYLFDFLSSDSFQMNNSFQTVKINSHQVLSLLSVILMKLESFYHNFTFLILF